MKNWRSVSDMIDIEYPKSIYKKYDIVEKEILGKKHYCLVRIYNFLGIKIPKRLKVAGYPCRISEYCGRFWHDNIRIIQDTIQSEKEDAEYKYRSELLNK